MSQNVAIANRLVEAEGRGELLSAVLEGEIRSDRDELTRTLIELHNAGSISLVSDTNLSAISALDKNEFWMAVHAFNDAIPALGCSHEDILKLVRCSVPASGGSG